MNARTLCFVVASVGVFGQLPAAEEAAAGQSPRGRELLRARAAEEAKKKPTAAPSAKSTKADENPAALASPASASPAKDPAAKSEAATTPAPAATTPVQPSAATTVLPKVEVRKDRITVLDHQLQEQQKEIEREKKNTVPTELDKALNDTKVSKALAIFGGQSGDYRANVAKERVKMMEEEKEVMEAIARAKTKADKEELQRQLDELRALRRELEKSLR